MRGFVGIAIVILIKHCLSNPINSPNPKSKTTKRFRNKRGHSRTLSNIPDLASLNIQWDTLIPTLHPTKKTPARLTRNPTVSPTNYDYSNYKYGFTDNPRRTGRSDTEALTTEHSITNRFATPTNTLSETLRTTTNPSKNIDTDSPYKFGSRHTTRYFKHFIDEYGQYWIKLNLTDCITQIGFALDIIDLVQ